DRRFKAGVVGEVDNKGPAHVRVALPDGAEVDALLAPVLAVLDDDQRAPGARRRPVRTPIVWSGRTGGSNGKSPARRNPRCSPGSCAPPGARHLDRGS